MQPDDRPDSEQRAVGEVLESSPGDLPRLSIVHLFIWTAVSAVYLALHRWYNLALNRVFDDLPTEFFFGIGAFDVVQAFFVGGTLTGFGVLIYARPGFGTRLLSQPGHWFLLTETLRRVSTLLGTLVPAYIAERTVEPPALFNNAQKVFSDAQELFSGLAIIVFLAIAVAYLNAALVIRARRWRLVFFAAAAVSAVFVLLLAAVAMGRFFFFASGFNQGLFQLSLFQYWANFLICVGTLVVAVWDIATRNHRDWLHWVGVMVFAGSVVAFTAWRLIASLF